MTTGKHHEIIFLVVFFAIVITAVHYSAYELDPTSTIIALFVGLLGAVFPDVDIGTSEVHKMVVIALLLIMLISFAIYHFTEDMRFLYVLIGSFFFAVFITLIHHRKFCHSLLFMFITTSCVWVGFHYLNLEWANPYIISFAWAGGFFLHLMADGELHAIENGRHIL